MQPELALFQFQCVDILDPQEFEKKILSGKKLTIKAGFDPTAPDLHFGHYVLLRKLRQFQDFGHKIILVVGDFTAQVGDPTGRSVTRKILTPEEITANAKIYQKQAFTVLSQQNCQIVYNSTWYNNMNLSDFLPLSALCSVSRTLERDDFAKRIAQQHPISLLEFMYPLLQAYDSVHLRCDVELGGSDQKFNLLLGRTLMKKFGLPPQVIITMPLLEGLDGVSKMSKSTQNYIALTDHPNDMYGKMMRIPDTLIQKYADLLWCKSNEERLYIIKRLASTENPKEIKSFLAEQIITTLLNTDLATQAKNHFQMVCSNKENPLDIPPIFVSSPTMSLLDLLLLCEPQKSKSELRRLIQQNAIKINNVTQTNVDRTISIEQNDIVKVGKRGFFKLSFSQGENPTNTKIKHS